MKNFSFFFFFFLVPALVFAQASKKLNQTFSLDNAQTIHIDAQKSHIKIERIQGSRILVEIAAHISTPNLTLLEFIAKKGRYNLTKILDSNTGELILTENKSNNPLIIKGEEVIEKISYTIYIPNSVKYVGINNSKLTLAQK